MSRTLVRMPSFDEAWALMERNRPAAALRIFQRIAREGDADAQVLVGYLYDIGRGARKSRSTAMRWYKLAARRGNPAAANNIGTIYRDEGRRALAWKWFHRAVRLGNRDALLELGKLAASKPSTRRAAVQFLQRLLASKQITDNSRVEGRRLLDRLRL